MNLEKLLQYLEFLKTECLRYASDDHTDENEVDLLQIEIDKFKTTLQGSGIDPSVKNLVSKIDFELVPKSKNKFIDILYILISFEWYYYRRKKENLVWKSWFRSGTGTVEILFSCTDESVGLVLFPNGPCPG